MKMKKEIKKRQCTSINNRIFFVIYMQNQEALVSVIKKDKHLFSIHALHDHEYEFLYFYSLLSLPLSPLIIYVTFW